jgi:alpha-L-arabinofuranosidase
MRELIEYLSAGKEKPYGAKRVALGQAAPWTKVFPVIHLELGNETWNWNSFAGEGWQDARAYAARTGDVFAAARATPGYDAKKFDLIMDGWFAVPWWNGELLTQAHHADTIDIAPYTFNPFNDASSAEAIYGPMFAEPEKYDGRSNGLTMQQAKLAAQHGLKLAIYEVNLGVYEGKVDQKALDATIPSLGAGISTADHMLQMLREEGIISQAVFALPEYANGFHNTVDPKANENVKLWGTVVDMGGQTNRVRPSFLAEELANEAIGDRMLETTASGANPVWNQADNGNAQVKLEGAHYIQSFAFMDGKRTSVVLFNLSRSTALPVTFSGAAAPKAGKVEMSRLTSEHINDTNEDADKVKIARSTMDHFDPKQSYMLPPFSMTVLTQ